LGATTTYSTASIDVGNAPPVAVDDSFNLLQGFDPVTSHLHILDNDFDPDGSLNMQMVEVVSGPVNGTVQIMSMAGHAGHAQYSPTDPNFIGSDSFTYRVQDNEGTWSNVATASINVTDGTVVGQSLSLDGTAGVDVADFSLGDGGADFTIEGWINFTDPQINGVDGFVGANSPVKNDINFNDGQAHVYIKGVGDVAVSTKVMGVDDPTHFAFVREGGITSIYVDGVLDVVGTTVWNGAFNIDKIGWATKGGALGLNGEIDELRFWDDARTATEIAQNYDQSIVTGLPNLVANYGFDGNLDDGYGTEAPLPGGGFYTDPLL